jgi:hypothetical protein
MISDLDLALACEYSYSGALQTWGNEAIHVYALLTPGRCIIAFEGTTDLDEWCVNFEAIPIEERAVNHVDLGYVHCGWFRSVESVQQQIIDFLKALPFGVELGCTGHSKGASEALIFAAQAKASGIQWARVSTFGTPHPGGLGGLIGSELGQDYRNGSDPVADVPFYLARPRPITLVDAPLPQFNTPNWGPAICHHIQNYIAAMRVLAV